MSSTAFDRLQPGHRNPFIVLMNFVIHVVSTSCYIAEKALSISPIDDDFEESTGHAFDKSGSVQMTSSLQYVAVYLSETKDIWSIFSIYYIT